MNLKDIFEKAENGTLTYDQFMALVNETGAKFTDLSEGRYVDKQKYADDLAARDTRITSLDEMLKTRDTDLATLQEQLKSAGTDAAQLTELSNNFSNLQKQYDKDTKALQKQLKDQAYKYAVTDFANQQNFTSQAAKRDFINTMMSKNLTVENDVIIGASDFMAAYSKDNADAFKVAEPEPVEPKPVFSGATGSSNVNDDANAFHFDFIGVRPKE